VSFLEDVTRRAKTAARRFAAKEPVAKTREEAAAQMRIMGDMRRELTVLETEMEEKISDIRQSYEKRALPHLEKYKGLEESLTIFAEAHRDELTDGGKRQSADLGSGALTWRKLPPKVSLRKLDDVIAAIHHFAENDADFAAFLRTTEEVNKEAMLANPEKAATLPGVSIGSEGETIKVEPLVEELNAAKQVKKRTRKLAA
jgi:phage host-nuclease inhibitor protein Gam